MENPEELAVHGPGQRAWFGDITRTANCVIAYGALHLAMSLFVALNEKRWMVALAGITLMIYSVDLAGALRVGKRYAWWVTVVAAFLFCLRYAVGLIGLALAFNKFHAPWIRLPVYLTGLCMAVYILAALTPASARGRYFGGNS